MTVSALILFFTFYPVIKEEIKYDFFPKKSDVKVGTRSEVKGISTQNVIVPVDEQFGIVIPKISANAKVIPEVDSQNSDIYQRALTKGVAHAKGTAFPDENGNTFIFAHSSADFFEASRYNAVFYLLSKLEMGDEIYLFYRGIKYQYRVTEKKNVSSEEAFYLEKNTPEKILTLMTCWPPGTTLRRLIVIAKPAS